MIPIIYVILSNNRSVNKNFLESIKEVVVDAIPYLTPGARYTLEKICGKEFWDSLNPGEQRRAGWCMKDLVVTGKLPLKIAESIHEYPVYYQLK